MALLTIMGEEALGPENAGYPVRGRRGKGFSEGKQGKGITFDT
ncbi:hypothetical protein T4D_12248 [Trichinella pseudospiralis]|uniref:Uncharacterized protein n=1 Tax=Trichinella pseudospiralis TaxID=6337 RepID=A0A0V1DM02_TRIPS|nr:hypothetical protein T4D_12248 [Trichinella pseudospiralis]